MIWKTALAICLTAALALFAQNAPRAQFNGCREGFCNPPIASAGCSATLALDGSQNAHQGSNSALAFPGLTTTHAGDIVIVLFDAHTNGGGTPAVSSPTLGTFTQRAIQDNSAVTSTIIWIYYAIASGTLSGEVVTFDASAFANGNYQTGTVLAISGANTSSPFDSGGPQKAATTGPVQITTANANDFIYGVSETSNTTSPSAGSGWTGLLTGPNYLLTEYQIVSTIQTALGLTSGTGNYGHGNIVDAVKRSC